MNEKQKIDPKDIRKGDLIRWERDSPGEYDQRAVEYLSACDGTHWSYNPGQHYLLDRPEPPFEPYWGMVIGEPHEHNNYGGVKAVYVPTGDGQNWFSHLELGGMKGLYSFDDGWAKRKLASGWVVIEKPEGVE